MSQKSVRLPPNPKAKLESEATAVSKDINEKEFAISDAGTYQTGRGRQGGPDFPAQYFPDTRSEDDRIQMKKELLAGERPLGDAQLSDKDIEYFLKKKQVKDRIVFDEWFSRLFDTDDINKQRLAQEIYPQFWQMKEDEIDRQAAIQKKLAMIKLRGVRDLDDLKFIFALNVGDIQLRAKPLYQLDEAPSEAEVKNKFKKGMWNPTRHFDYSAGFEPPKSTGRSMFDGYTGGTSLVKDGVIGPPPRIQDDPWAQGGSFAEFLGR